MKLVEVKNKKEFDKHKGHQKINFLQKFWLSLILTIPVLFFSDLIQNLFRFNRPEFPGSRFVPLLLSSIVFFYGGWVFIASAIRELKARLPGMMTLIALATSVAYGYSVFATLTDLGGDLYWELTSLITIMLLGHYLEMKAVQGAQSALNELSKLLPDTAEIIIQDLKSKDQKDSQKFKVNTKIVAVSQLKVNDLVLVRPGGKIPVDGMVVDGLSTVNEAAITGESRPVDKKAGSEVIAGTINGDGSLQIKVSKIGEKTFLAGIMRLVAEAQASKSRLQMLSDKAAFILTVVAVISGIITFVVWMISRGEIVFAMQRLVAVLVIACPHALGLAIPLVASISTTLGARNGLLIKKRLALEAARNINIVLFDKTGTLTTGQYGWKK